MSLLLAFLFLLIASLYAAAGHGGGSGYLAVMGIMDVEPALMKPTALTLNVLVAAIATWRYYGAGHFAPRLFWPVALTSVPLAFVGGRLSLPAEVYRPLVGLILLYAAYHLYSGGRNSPSALQRTASVPLLLLMGAVIGLLSGLIGVGGGIFLAPVLLLNGWASPHTTLGITAPFVLVNSLSGLSGHVVGGLSLPQELPLWLSAAALGGWLGAGYASKHLDPAHLVRLLALILVLGGLRLIFL